MRNNSTDPRIAFLCLLQAQLAQMTPVITDEVTDGQQKIHVIFISLL